MNKDQEEAKLLECKVIGTVTANGDQPTVEKTVWGHAGSFIHETGTSNKWYFRMRTGAGESQGQACLKTGYVINKYEYSKIATEPEYIDRCEISDVDDRKWKVELLKEDKPDGEPGEVTRGYKGRFEHDDDELQWYWVMMLYREGEGGCVDVGKCAVLVSELAKEPQYIEQCGEQVGEDYRVWEVTRKKNDDRANS